jgi:hypothetical protein
VVAEFSTYEDEDSITSTTLSDEGQQSTYELAKGWENSFSSSSVANSLGNVHLAVVDEEDEEGMLESDPELISKSVDTTTIAAAAAAASHLGFNLEGSDGTDYSTL